ncbi:MAG: PAS domain-containing protein [Verrucomicrobia bacterium]|nr:PAS domain-containing protein [Verrucomicrobiota bacterium]
MPPIEQGRNTSKPLHLLIVEDCDDEAQLVVSLLSEGGYAVVSKRVETAEAMRAALDRGPWDIVISDYYMPQFDGLAALRLLRKNAPNIPFIMVTGTLGEEVAAGIMKAGTDDFLLKDRLARLGPVVERVLREAEERRQRKRTEEALRVSEERFRQIAENIREVFWMADPQIQRMLYISPAYEEIWGRSWTDLYENPGSSLEAVHPEDRERVIKNLAVKKDGLPFDHEYRIVRPDGAIRWVRDRGFPVKDKAGQVTQYVGVAWDITDRKQAEEKVRNLNAELEQRVVQRTAELEATNQELEAFSYSVSHDLRAPLRAISGYVNMLIEDNEKQLDEEGRRKLGLVRKEAAHMSQLIDDLLAFSRTGRQSMQSAEIDMCALAQQAFDECAAQTPGRNIQFKLHPLPLAQGDFALLHQVWVNLISNAIKYTRPKGVAVIEIGGRTEGGELLYYVKDNGVGFDMDYAQKLFGVFQRLHSSEEFEGTGVGLALLQRIIHRHDGRVWAEGKLNEGATFFFTLPRSVAAGS